MATPDDAPLGEDELAIASEVMGWSFAFPVAEAGPWLRSAGVENIRVQRRDGVLEALLVTVPMGQYFGGRSVPMVGIAGVAAAPEARGSGTGQRLLTRVLREERAKGFALSALYPATLGLYRKLGYESAGGHYTVKAPLTGIATGDRTLPIRLMTDADGPAVEACYRAKAARVNGFLDRGPYVWNRVREPRGAAAPRGFVVGESGAVEGYIFVHQKRDTKLLFTLHASDLVASTSRAMRRLLTFAADHGTLGTHFEWNAAPSDPSVHLLPRVGHEVSLHEAWMLRLLDVEKAMTARGWPTHLRAELDLEIADDTLADNAGRWILRIADGHAGMARGGRGTIRIDVRALASLYSAWRDPYAIAGAGGLETSDAEMAALAEVFAGASPWMPDFF